MIKKGLFFALLLFMTATLRADTALQRVIDDYIKLYTKDTLIEWKKLFHPSVMVFFPGDEGTVTVRNLDEFFERQQNYFTKRKSISERLENLQIYEGRRVARVVADFIFIDEGVEKAGKLGLHLVQGNDGWKIVSVLFSYDNP